MDSDRVVVLSPDGEEFNGAPVANTQVKEGAKEDPTTIDEDMALWNIYEDITRDRKVDLHYMSQPRFDATVKALEPALRRDGYELVTSGTTIWATGRED